MTALAIMGLLPKGSSQTGDIVFGETALSGMSEEQLCAIRGDDIQVIILVSIPISNCHR